MGLIANALIFIPAPVIPVPPPPSYLGLAEERTFDAVARGDFIRLLLRLHSGNANVAAQGSVSVLAAELASGEIQLETIGQEQILRATIVTGEAKGIDAVAMDNALLLFEELV